MKNNNDSIYNRKIEQRTGSLKVIWWYKHVAEKVKNAYWGLQPWSWSYFTDNAHSVNYKLLMKNNDDNMYGRKWNREMEVWN